MEAVQKWATIYSGKQNVLEFLERVKELAIAHYLSFNILSRMMRELLRYNALLWYRNNNLQWDIWSKFCERLQNFFLPPRHFERLEDDIRQTSKRKL